MWKRLKFKVLGSSCTSRSNNHSAAGTAAPPPPRSNTIEELLSSNDLDLSENEDPDLIKDSRKMSFPYLDKCSCGSPGFSGKDNFRRKSDSLRRKNTLISEINRKNESGRKDTPEVAKNEYTKPEILFDERRKIVATTATTTTSSSSLATTTTTTNVITTTNTGVIRRDDVDKTPNDKNKNNELKEPGTRSRIAIQRSSAGLEDDSDSDDDDEAEPEVGRSSSKETGNRDSGGSSDYTSLAFDVNYVRVSPPKMTRRQKQNEAREIEQIPKRGSRLTGFKDDVTPEIEPRRSRLIQPPIRSDVPTISGNDRKSPKTSPKTSIIAEGTLTSVNPDVVSTSVIETNSFRSDANDYISLQDLQNQIRNPPIHESVPPRIIDVAPEASVAPIPAVEVYPTKRSVVDQLEPAQDDQQGDSVTLIQEGDSSVLEFTFTVRLENDVIRRMKPEESETRSGDSNTGSPVVSGSVNILKSDHSTVNVLKPVITVGLRSVTVDGVESAKSGDPEGVSTSRKVLQEVVKRSSSSKHQARSKHHPEEPTKPALDDPQSRSWTGNRSYWTEGVKTVTWAVDTSGVAATSSSSSHTLKPRAKPDVTKRDLERTQTVRKQQTLADFMSSQHHTKITTIAIVHKSADFDDDGPDVTSPGSTPVVSPSVARTTPEQTPRRVPTRIEKEPELTHMSWDEVMDEAMALGIPLQRPGSGTTRSQQHQLHRRSSVSSVIGELEQLSSTVDVKMVSSWACPSCAQEKETATRSGGGRDPDKQHAKKGSPFKDRFKFQNLFSRRSKDDDGGKSRENKNTGKAGHHQHHQQQQQPSAGSQAFHTLPGGKSMAGIEEPTCQRCTSATTKAVVVGGGGGVTQNKTMSPGRIQSPFKMSIFSGTTIQRRTTINGGSDGGSRGGSQWNSPTGKNNSSVTDHHRDSSTANPGSTLSPKQRTGCSNDFLKSLEQLKTCGWYWGPLGFEEAEVRLTGKPDGAFLVRDSSDDRYILSLSFRSQGTTHHTRIEHYRGMFSFYAQQNIHEAATIVEFIENAMRHSLDGKCLYYLRPRSPSSPPAPVQLLYPVLRFFGVLSMKHLAQAAILRHVRRPELVDRLPLSRVDKESLKRFHQSCRQKSTP